MTRAKSRPKRDGKAEVSVPASFDATLKKLVEVWAETGFDQRELKRGATRRELGRFRKKIGRPMPRDFERLYAWHNGSGQREIYGYYRLLSLNEIVQYRRSTSVGVSGHLESWRPGEYWNEAWISFLEFNGDFLCLDLSASTAPILVFDNYATSRDVRYSSLLAWLKTLVELWRRAPRADEAAWCEFFDFSPEAKRIRKQLNPGYPIRRRARLVPVKRAPKNLEVQRRQFKRGDWFWFIALVGATVQRGSGNETGISIRTTEDEFDSVEAAEKFVAKQIASKKAEGYRPAKSVEYSDDDELKARAVQHLTSLTERN